MITALARTAGRARRALDDFPANHAGNFWLLGVALLAFAVTAVLAVRADSTVGLVVAAAGVLLCVAAGVDRVLLMRVSAGQDGS